MRSEEQELENLPLQKIRNYTSQKEGDFICVASLWEVLLSPHFKGWEREIYKSEGIASGTASEQLGTQTCSSTDQIPGDVVYPTGPVRRLMLEDYSLWPIKSGAPLVRWSLMAKGQDAPSRQHNAVRSRNESLPWDQSSTSEGPITGILLSFFRDPGPSLS